MLSTDDATSTCFLLVQERGPIRFLISRRSKPAVMKDSSLDPIDEEIDEGRSLAGERKRT
jgi:hypothetical protein